MTGKDLLGKADALSKFEYSPLGSGSKKQISVPKKQYQGLKKLLKANEKQEELVTIKK